MRSQERHGLLTACLDRSLGHRLGRQAVGPQRAFLVSLLLRLAPLLVLRQHRLWFRSPHPALPSLSIPLLHQTLVQPKTLSRFLQPTPRVSILTPPLVLLQPLRQCQLLQLAPRSQRAALLEPRPL